MPENIPYRGPVPLRYRLEPHRAGGKTEQLQVLLQNEEREFMPGGRREEGAHQRKDVLADPGAAALHDRGRKRDPHRRPLTASRLP